MNILDIPYKALIKLNVLQEAKNQSSKTHFNTTHKYKHEKFKWNWLFIMKLQVVELSILFHQNFV